MKIINKIRKIFKKQNDYVYATNFANRSISDNGTYLKIVRDAVNSDIIFDHFKSDPRYKAILEHSTKEQANLCLELIREQNNFLLDKINEFKENDIVGSPKIEDFKRIGSISPSTIRYVKVASDLINLFGNKLNGKIAEVGVGYGGQCLILDKIYKNVEFELFDLPDVLNLASKYLERHILRNSYDVLTINKCHYDKKYELVISNYAFSELPKHLQITYLEKVIKKSKRGYMIMNSGTSESAFQSNHLSLEEIKEYIPNIEILKEQPQTHSGNYLIVWNFSDTQLA